MQCGGGNLEIGIGEWQPKAVKLSVDIAAGARDGGVVAEDRNRWKDPGFYLLEMKFAVRRPVCPLVEFPNDDGAGELLGARNGFQPAKVGGQRPAAQNLGNGVGVEEKGHALTSERRRASRRRPAKLPNRVR